jgi:hypothetical protein
MGAHPNSYLVRVTIWSFAYFFVIIPLRTSFWHFGHPPTNKYLLLRALAFLLALYLNASSDYHPNDISILLCLLNVIENENILEKRIITLKEPIKLLK